MIDKRNLVNSIIACLTLLYPIAVYFSVQYIEPWKISVTLLFLILVRLSVMEVDKRWNRVLLLIGVLYCFLSIWSNNLITLLFYPVLISLSLFFIFFTSLFYPPPIVERLARLQHPDLPEDGVVYTRKVTQIWSIFFIINSLIAAITAVWCSFAWWSLYNGLISYVLMGLLMSVEYLVRVRTQDHVR